jgi:hypothetical protein
VKLTRVVSDPKTLGGAQEEIAIGTEPCRPIKPAELAKDRPIDEACGMMNQVPFADFLQQVRAARETFLADVLVLLVDQFQAATDDAEPPAPETSSRSGWLISSLSWKAM